MSPRVVHVGGHHGSLQVTVEDRPTPLWLDRSAPSSAPRRSRTTPPAGELTQAPAEAVAFLSHAGLVAAPRGGGTRERQGTTSWLCTERTARLVGDPRLSAGALLSPFGRPFALGQLRLELVSSGRMPGAALLAIDVDIGRERHDGGRVLYAAEISGEPTLCGEPPDFRPCQTLVVGCRVSPLLTQPSAAEAQAAIVERVEQVLGDGGQPIVLCDPIGDAQELVHLLGHRGHTLRAHRSIHEGALRYLELGIDLRGLRPLRGSPGSGEVLLWPRQLRGSPMVTKLRRSRFLLCAPEVPRLEGEAARRLHHVEATLPLPTAADRVGLDRLVGATGAREVFTVGPMAVEQALFWRAHPPRGVRLVSPLPRPGITWRQLELGLSDRRAENL